MALGIQVESMRDALQTMVDSCDAEAQRHELQLLRRELHHAIRILKSPHPLRRYTCLMHALRFTEKPEYVAYALRDIYAGAEFAHWLLARDRLEVIAEPDAQPGDLMFYFNAGQFTHAGVLRKGGRLVSKWGTFHLCSHAPFEVPRSYGDETMHFKRPSYRRALRHFVEYGAESGVVLTRDEMDA
jgi:hypothetical protein